MATPIKDSEQYITGIRQNGELNGIEHSYNGANHADIEVEAESPSVYFDQLKTKAQEYALPTFDIETDIAAKVASIERGRHNLRPLQSVPSSIVNSNDGRLRTAGAYFSVIMNPIVARGKDAYEPTDADKADFCERLTRGVDVVTYYALSKTRSPRRTGSPDTKIDLAEAEMLKYMAVMARTAEAVGLNMRVVVVDETAIMPEDPYLGFSASDKKSNQAVAQAILQEYNAQDKVVVRSLVDSVVAPLGNDFGGLYETRHQRFAAEALQQLQNGEVTPLSIRMFTFLDCMPNEGLAQMGIGEGEIARIRSEGKNIDLRSLPGNLIDYLTTVTAHVNSVMDLRVEAASRVASNGHTTDYPEYNPDRMYGGVTRSRSRWGFLPHPKKNMGRVINPMHGLALYTPDRTEYLGVAPYNELLGLQDRGRAQLISIGNKPVAGYLTK